MPHLVEMHEKYMSQGVVLIALSDESESKVKPWIEKHKASYIIGSGAKRTLEDYGVKGFPTVYLIDPKGKVAWKGHTATVEKALEDLLEKSPPKQKGFLAAKSAKKAYKRAVKLYDEKEYAKAFKALESAAKQFKGTKSAKRARSRIKKMKANSRIMEIIAKEKAERISKGWLEVAHVLLQYGDKKDALRYYRRIIKKYPDTNYAKIAREEKEALESD